MVHCSRIHDDEAELLIIGAMVGWLKNYGLAFEGLNDDDEHCIGIGDTDPIPSWGPDVALALKAHVLIVEARFYDDLTQELLPPTMLLALPAGYLADRFDRRRLLILSLWGMTLSSFALATFSYIQGSVVLMYILLFLDASAVMLGRLAMARAGARPGPSSRMWLGPRRSSWLVIGRLLVRVWRWGNRRVNPAKGQSGHAVLRDRAASSVRPSSTMPARECGSSTRR